MTTTTKTDRDRLFAKYFMNHLATLFGPENEAFSDLIIMACDLGDDVHGPDADRLLEAVQAAALEADSELAEEHADDDAWPLADGYVWFLRKDGAPAARHRDHGWVAVVDGRVFSHGTSGHPADIIHTLLARWEAGRRLGLFQPVQE